MNPLQSNEFFDDPFTMSAKAKEFELGMKWLTRAMGGKEPSFGLAHTLLNDLRTGGIKDAKFYFNATRTSKREIGEVKRIEEYQRGKVTPRIN